MGNPCPPMSQVPPPARLSSTDDAATDPTLTSKNLSSINSTLLTSNVTIIIAILLLAAVLALACWIVAKLRHIPTLTAVHSAITKRMKTTSPTKLDGSFY